jgi:hypothetical protein
VTCFLARLLEADEREIVLGDLAECRATKSRALKEIAGLVARRQVALWTGWRPWTAFLALLVPLSLALSWHSRQTADSNATTLWLYFNNWDWGLLSLSAFRHDFPLYIAAVLFSFLSLGCWSWVVGFVIGAASPRTAPLNGVLLFLLLLLGEFAGSLRHLSLLDPNGPVFQVLFYRAIFPLIVQTVLVMLPAGLGMRDGVTLPRFRPSLRIALWSAAFLSLAVTEASDPLVRLLLGRPMLLTSSPMHVARLAAYWPVIYWFSGSLGSSKEKNA